MHRRKLIIITTFFRALRTAIFRAAQVIWITFFLNSNICPVFDTWATITIYGRKFLVPV
jgi:hypothetical protein